MAKYLSDFSYFPRLRRGQSHCVLPYFANTKVSKIFSLSKQIPEKISLNTKFRENITLPLFFCYILLRHCRVALNRMLCIVFLFYFINNSTIFGYPLSFAISIAIFSFLFLIVLSAPFSNKSVTIS